MIAERDTSTKWCCDQDVKPSQEERAIGAFRCKKERMLLQPLGWRCAECAVDHERNVREEQHPYIRGPNKQ